MVRRNVSAETRGYIVITYMKEVETRIIQNSWNPIMKIGLRDWGMTSRGN